ncbi:MAG: hypothetical protein H6742_19445 [Alphaproteobacteria bacterium]|nr:hypothetical protein [Alphaproteobacteria bacterium]
MLLSPAAALFLWTTVLPSQANAAPDGRDDTLLGGEPPGWGVVEAQGYGELRFSWTDAYGTPWQLTERVRPTGTLHLHERWNLELTLDAATQQGRYPPDESRKLLDEIITKDDTFDNLDDALEFAGCSLDTKRRYDEVGDVLAVDRLFVEAQYPAIDLRLGRQSVSWGSAKVLNPTDVFAEYILAEPWRERAGVDALRATVPLTERGLVTVVGGFDDLPAELRDLGDDSLPDDWQALAWKAGGRGTYALGPVDLSLVGFHQQSGSQGRTLGGVDIAGDTEIGWWVEAAWDGDVRASVGADYSFDVLQGLYIALQGHHDGGGDGPDTMDYRSAADSAFDSYDYTIDCLGEVPDQLPLPDPSERGDPVGAYRATKGRWYGLAIVRQTITQDWRIDGVALVNLEDGTGLVFPSTTVYVGGFLSLNAGVQLLVGRDGEFQPPEEALTEGIFDLNPLVPRATALTWVRASF